MTDSTPLGKLRPGVKALWLDALRSGEYQQAQRTLQVRKEDGSAFCCLGVLCDVALKNGVPVVAEPALSTRGEPIMRYIAVDEDAHLDSGLSYPPSTVASWAYEVAPDMVLWTVWADVRDNDHAGVEELPVLNDEFEMDFAAIADLIEASL
jgi:hypothetical protein